MKDFLYQAYSKEPDSISKKELATLTYLNIATVAKNTIIDDFWEFTYSKEPYSIHSLPYTQTIIYMPITKIIEQLDFTLLTGLEYINYNNSSDIESTTESCSLKGLDKLVYYGGDFNRSLTLSTK